MSLAQAKSSYRPILGADEEQAIIDPRPRPGFVETAYIKGVIERALGYIKAGFPVHFRGATGTGKTTLALHLASQIGRPAVLMHGDAEYTTSDLIGGENGYRFKKLRDNFIQSVLKEEETFAKNWVDNRLTVAAKHGFTLIYDEFTRSRPEANNTLLSVLQEGIVDLPASRQGEESHYLKVHPDFVAIFTSNPEEYAGTNKAPDALRDRMVTMDLPHFDEDTEVGITAKKSGLDRRDARKIVKVVRALRASGKCEFSPTVRSAAMVAKAAKTCGCKVSASDRLFRELMLDIIASKTSRLGEQTHHKIVKKAVDELIDKYC